MIKLSSHWTSSLCCLLLSALSACATPRTLAPAIPISAPFDSAAGPAWHSCRARIAWPADAGPDWGVDAFLAGAVFAPALVELGPQLRSWRWHRRAVRDAAGHQFSLLFYADTNASEQLITNLAKQPRLQQALDQGVLSTFDCSDLPHWSGADFGASSDPAWSPALQQAWPHFIHGSSQLWLELLRAQPIAADAPLPQLLEDYRRANEALNQTWASEGRHALLHHLNAIFGYQPLPIRF